MKNITTMDNQTFCSECKNTTDALRNGHLECLFYAHDENGCPGDEWTCNSAAEKYPLEFLEYVHENGSPKAKWVCFTYSILFIFILYFLFMF